MKTAILVGVNTNGHGKDYKQIDNFEYSMQEMERLIEACDMKLEAVMEQNMVHPDAATYIGSGKLDELSQLSENMQVDYIIFADNLSPAQLKNIQRQISYSSVMDRTSLILEIFAIRAKTREARLQVEWANLQYMLPRLVGMRESLGRQGGGSGSISNKGQGETQLELDRRHIEKRIVELKRDLEAIERDRDIQRRKRDKSGIPRVALVGYTNAGKSTLMNACVEFSGSSEEKQVFEKNMLFATLDTTVRKIETGNNKDFILSDTVGFVDNLPHNLIKAFRSTLDEVRFADLILIVADYNDEHFAEHIKITESTLVELGADRIPRIYVYNKADLKVSKLPIVESDRIYMSAFFRTGLKELMELILNEVYAGNEILEMCVPYNRGDIINILNDKSNILAQEYREDGVYIKADCTKAIAGYIRKHIIE